MPGPASEWRPTHWQLFLSALFMGVVTGIMVNLVTAGDDFGIATGAIIGQIVWWTNQGVVRE